MSLAMHMRRRDVHKRGRRHCSTLLVSLLFHDQLLLVDDLRYAYTAPLAFDLIGIAAGGHISTICHKRRH